MRNYRARGVTKDGKPIFSESHEAEIVAAWLDAHRILYFHPVNEGKRSWAGGKQLKRQGMKAGVPDFLIFDPPPPMITVAVYPVVKGVALELKALDGKPPTRDQTDFMSQLANRDWVTAWHRGAEAAIAWLESLGYGR